MRRSGDSANEDVPQYEPREGGFREPGNVVARGPVKNGSDRTSISRPISYGLPPGDKTKAPEDGIKTCSTVGRAKVVNFSLFLRPALMKAAKTRCGGVAELGCGSGLVRKAVGSTRGTGAENRTCGPERKVDCDGDIKHHIWRNPDPLGNPGSYKRLWEPSNAIPASKMEEKSRPQGTELSFAPRVPATSACSHSASNDLKVSLKRRCEDCRTSSQSDSDSEDSGRPDRAGGMKERRHSARRSSERGRRGRINEKLRALQDLLPNCDKVDQAGVLDEAIDYLKTLQQQFLVLSTGSPMYMPCPMILPAGIQQMYAPRPYPGQFTSFNVQRGMNIGAEGLQFPISPGPTTAALGLQQPMPSVPPFVPSTGRSSARSLSPDYPRRRDTVDDLLDSADLSGSSSDEQS